jgi:hypothetical protein
VHVKSQIENKPPNFAEQLAEGVRLFIAGEGYDIPPSEVAEALKGDLTLMPQTLFALILKHGYDRDRVAQSMAKGAQMFNAQTATNTVPNGDGAHKYQSLKEINVKDIQEFRSTLNVGEKPSPICPLETFYECGSPRL